MAQPNLEDILAPFDPTGYTTISGAQLLQLISGATPYTDKGLLLVTADIGDVPQVPDAVTNVKWQRYGWIRVQTQSASLYVWSPNSASDITFLNWVSVSVANIPAGSITGAQIANNTITDIKIANVSYGKLLNAPSTVNNGSAASGALAGTYPAPTLAPNAVNNPNQITAGIITGQAGGNIAASTIDFSNLKGDGTVNDMLRTATITTAVEWFTPPFNFMKFGNAFESANLLLANANLPIICTGQLQGSGSLGYGVATHTTLQIKTYQASSATSSATNLIATTAPTTSNTANYGGLSAKTFTPISSTSTILIEMSVATSNNSGAYNGVFLFEGTNFINGGFTTITANACGNVVFTAMIVNQTAGTPITFNTYYAANTGTMQINELGGTGFWGGAGLSTMKITEYL